MRHLSSQNIYLIVIFTGILLFSSCIKNEYSIDDLSLHSELNMGLAIPVVKGELQLSNLTNNKMDTLLTINNNQISFIINKENIFSLKAKDVIKFPDNETSTFTIKADRDYPLFNLPKIEIPYLNLGTYYEIALYEGMKIDSVFLNSGSLTLTINNEFDHDIDLRVYSKSLISESGSRYSNTLSIPRNSQQQLVIDLSLYKIEAYTRSNGNTAVSIDFSPTIYNSGSNVIYEGQKIDIDFELNGWSQFEAIYGDIGHYSQVLTETISIDEDIPFLNSISGDLAITNPILTLYYQQSFGLPLGIDLDLLSYGENSILIEPPFQTINCSTNPQNPYYSGEMVFTKENTHNLNRLISIPLADSISFMANLITNPNSQGSNSNFVFDHSEINLDAKIEVPLEINANLSLIDTLANPMIDYENNTSAEIEYVDLHYRFINHFPIDFDATVLLFDSINNETLNTIELNSNPDQPFISGAEVENSMVTKPTTTVGILSLTNENINSLLQQSTHLIVNIQIVTSNNEDVNITTDSKIEFKIGLDASGTYVTDFETDENE